MIIVTVVEILIETEGKQENEISGRECKWNSLKIITDRLNIIINNITGKNNQSIFLQSGLFISSNWGQVRSPLYLPDHCPIREIERTAVQHPSRLPVESEGSSLSI